MLLREGLLGAANRLFRLPAGFYGLTTILLFVACMTLARVRNPESLRYQAPGEWGAILGLDRGPETKTLRRKLKLLASAEHTVRDWQSALARTWATEHQDDWATLAVDGHVKVYTGRNGRLPKHFVARQKLCLPASVSYWINALGGTPLLCLHQALDPKLIKAIEQDVVPQLQQLGVMPEAPPDLTRPEAGAPALTLVFDREGWSPDLFKRLARRGIACITWHKNFKGEDWPEEDFHPLEVPIHAPAGTSATTVDVAEKPIVLRNGLTVRQIRRRLATGRQVPVITSPCRESVPRRSPRQGRRKPDSGPHPSERPGELTVGRSRATFRRMERDPTIDDPFRGFWQSNVISRILPTPFGCSHALKGGSRAKCRKAA